MNLLIEFKWQKTLDELDQMDIGRYRRAKQAYTDQVIWKSKERTIEEEQRLTYLMDLYNDNSE